MATPAIRRGFHLARRQPRPQPHTPDGCLCYTVQDAPVQFTKGLSRLLNGISQHLY
jgi:anti-sigma factor ChrR (cupin superfamily)